MAFKVEVTLLLTCLTWPQATVVPQDSGHRSDPSLLTAAWYSSMESYRSVKDHSTNGQSSCFSLFSLQTMLQHMFLNLQPCLAVLLFLDNRDFPEVGLLSQRLSSLFIDISRWHSKYSIFSTKATKIMVKPLDWGFGGLTHDTEAPGISAAAQKVPTKDGRGEWWLPGGGAPGSSIPHEWGCSQPGGSPHLT